VLYNEQQPAITTGSQTSTSPLNGAGQSLDFIRNGTVRLSASQAGVVIRECRYWHQTRDKYATGQAHVRNLCDYMRRGQWRKYDKIDFARLDGKLVLMNGHHRMQAQMMSGASIDWLIVIHDCSSKEEVDRLFTTFDTNLRKRGRGVILDAIDLSSKIGCDKQSIIALYEATKLLQCKFGKRDLVFESSIDLRSDYCLTFKRELRAWETAVKPAATATKKRLREMPILAVAMLTFRDQPNDANEFWGGVAKDNGLLRGDPRQAFLRYLRYESENKSTDKHAPALYTAIAWNAWFEQRSLQQLKLMSKTQFFIAGCNIG
jgi:hypothetical protein